MSDTTVLRAEDIFMMSERESGAYGVADEGLRSRFAAMVETINARGPFAAGRARAIHVQLQRLLTNRLRIELDSQRNPAIGETEIVRPIFIIGLARSGTTLLHSLLSEHPETLKPQSWNMYSPSPPPGAGPVAPERIAFAQRMIEDWMDFCPGQKPMHPYIDKGAFQLCEDEEIYTLDFRNAYCYHLYEAPIDSTMSMVQGDPVEAYRFHKMFLQQMQWNTGLSQWVCKGPSHPYALAALFEVYPDALCVWPHRPIAEILPSNAMLSGVIFDTIQGKPADPGSEGRALAEGMRAGLETLFNDDLVDDPRILHLKFRDVAADPAAAVRKIWGHAGRKTTSEYEAKMRAWLDDPANAADRYGRYPYSFEALGLTREWIDDMFCEYSRRFDLV